MQDIPREALMQVLREGLQVELSLERDRDFDPLVFIRVLIRLTFNGEYVAEADCLARLPSEDAP